jgi:hypothetical protein
MGFSRISREVSKEKEVRGVYWNTHIWGQWIHLYGSTNGKSSYIIFFHKHIYNDMLLIATGRKLRPVLHLNPFSYFARGLRDQTLNTLMPCVVRWPKID